MESGQTFLLSPSLPSPVFFFKSFHLLPKLNRLSYYTLSSGGGQGVPDFFFFYLKFFSHLKIRTTYRHMDMCHVIWQSLCLFYWFVTISAKKNYYKEVGWRKKKVLFLACLMCIQLFLMFYMMFLLFIHSVILFLRPWMMYQVHSYVFLTYPTVELLVMNLVLSFLFLISKNF